MKWLQDNLITDKDDIDFLTKEVEEFEARLAERNLEGELLRGVCLDHVMMDDEIHIAYTNLNQVLNRTKLDAWNSVIRPPDFYDLASNLYNNPETNMYSKLQEDFKQPIKLFYKDVPTPVTPQKIKGTLADIRAQLVVIIDNWERSGNGGGNRSIGDNYYVLQKDQ